MNDHHPPPFLFERADWRRGREARDDEGAEAGSGEADVLAEEGDDLAGGGGGGDGLRDGPRDDGGRRDPAVAEAPRRPSLWTATRRDHRHCRSRHRSRDRRPRHAAAAAVAIAAAATTTAAVATIIPAATTTVTVTTTPSPRLRRTGTRSAVSRGRPGGRAWNPRRPASVRGLRGSVTRQLESGRRDRPDLTTDISTTSVLLRDALDGADDDRRPRRR